MALFAVAHGAGDVGWSWHLVAAELTARGHDTVTPDLPCEDETAGLEDYVSTVVDSVGDRAGPVVVIGHSLGGVSAPVVADRIGAAAVVLVNAMVPAPGEPANDWWDATGYTEASRAAADADGGLTGNDDLRVCFFHDLPPALADEASRRGRDQTGAVMADPWPLTRWPSIPTFAVVGARERMFPPPFQRRVLAERLGLPAERVVEIDGGHCLQLSRPVEVAGVLDRVAREVGA